MPFSDKAAHRPRLPEFLACRDFAPGSFHAVLCAFLREKNKEITSYSVNRLYASLYPLGEAIKNPPLTAVSYNDLREYNDALYRRYTPGTIKPVVGYIKQFFKWAKRRKYITINPAKRLRKPSKKTLARTAKPKAVPEAVIQRVILYLVAELSPLIYRGLFGLCSDVTEWGYHEREMLRDLFLITLIYETGARAGEVWRLSSRVMDEACGVSRPVYEVVATGKTNDQLLRFTEATAELWRIWQQVRPHGYDEFAVVAFGDTTPPRPMNTRTLGKAISRRCKQAGASPVFRSHALRHSKIKRCKQLFGLEITSRLIGHSTVETTDGYGNDDEEDTAVIEAAARTGLTYRLFDS